MLMNTSKNELKNMFVTKLNAHSLKIYKITLHPAQHASSTGLSNAWPAMLSGVARVEIKAVKKLHGGKNFDAITKLHRNYFGSYSIKISILIVCII